METNVKEQLDEILSQYNGGRDGLIPILQEAQGKFGYLPEEVMRRIAKFLRLPESTVYAVATFYAQFKLAPSGKRVVKVCQGPACHMQGRTYILREVEKRLGIKPGESTEDLKYALETTTCSGSCALAPVIEIDEKVYGQMTTTKVGHILSDTK